MRITSSLTGNRGAENPKNRQHKDTGYKWIALSITTIEMFMVSVNGSIILISLPAIFDGIHIDPLTSFQYLIWVLMGYNLVTATLLLSFGRLSDMYGRVRLYNIGFAVFTLGSVLLFLAPNTSDAGAIEIIAFRLVQAVGASFTFSNSAASLTDAFPENERGKALGVEHGVIPFWPVHRTHPWRNTRVLSLAICIPCKSGTIPLSTDVLSIFHNFSCYRFF
jgi:nitrate/nitrite transporter NarK